MSDSFLFALITPGSDWIDCKISGSVKPGNILNSLGLMVILPLFFIDIPLVNILLMITSSNTVILFVLFFFEMIICPSSRIVNLKSICSKIFSKTDSIFKLLLGS